MQLKYFQSDAVHNLKQAFYKLWQGSKDNAFLTFQSPTGSGKTVMMAEFLKQLCASDNPKFNVDIAFVWLSKGELATQSKHKLFDYYHGHGNHLLDLHDLNKGLMKKHNIFFVNWEKVISRSRENRKLRTDGEVTTSFDTFIKNTQDENRTIVMIVDEAHLNLNTKLAKEIVDIINPRISIYVSATPKHIPNMLQATDNIGRFVKVNHNKVVEEGLIKESIKIMPKEEIMAQNSDQDLDKLLLDLALEKQRELSQAYQDIEANINPLILVQLPNDEKNKPTDDGQTKKELCQQYFADKGLHPNDVAIWLSEKKENLADIVKPYSHVNVLIFKQAIATGWDCPRAQILVSFREMKNPVFKTQVFGRILRMPEAKHYENKILNHAYCYTSYEQQDISNAIPKDGENQPKHLVARLKIGIDNVYLPSVFLGRTDYNDLGHTFRTTFVKTANAFFGLENDLLYNNTKLKNKGFDTTQTCITNQLIVNVNIEVYDDFIRELSDVNNYLNHESSYNDVRKFYELLLHKELLNQEANSKFGNVSRSWRTLKNAFNVWLKPYIPDELKRYAAISNNLSKTTNSVLKQVVEKALTTYRPIREIEVKKRAKKERVLLDFKILPEYRYSDNYQECQSIKKYVLDKCYINCLGDEMAFIKYLEQQNIDWWYKNADNGREAFGIEYIDNHNINRVFYPDFIIKQGDKIGIFDTKSGITAEVAKPKAEALQQYIIDNSGTYTFKDESDNPITKKQILWGGIVILTQNNIFKLNNNKEYNIDINNFHTLTFDK